MTHKSFYQAAVAEVAAGHLDSALWIKINAEMPSADNAARQAKYIALRAQEIADESLRTSVSRFKGPHGFGYLAIAGVLALVLIIALFAVTA
jgi:hypothetical protein